MPTRDQGVGGAGTVRLVVDGVERTVVDDGGTLLDALRFQLGITSVKDGCAPQGQCGCCTVLVDGSPRVACVTPLRRVTGRSVTTVDGLPASRRWAEALCATGGSQCGFCTPGIIVRLAGRGVADAAGAARALGAHLCRCTGWRTILEAVELVDDPDEVARRLAGRDWEAASARASLEGGTPQRVGPAIALGRGGFADDTAPPGALVAMAGDDGDWHVAATVTEARRVAGTPGRRNPSHPRPPLEPPPGDWALTLATSWVEPAYLEPDASWCEPGGEPASPLANGGAFGGKLRSPVPGAARRLADTHGRTVRALWRRPDVVRHGPKRPPVAAGVREDGTGHLRVVATPGVAELMARVAPDWTFEEVEVPGPPTSLDLRAAVWGEVSVLRAAVSGSTRIVAPGGGVAEAVIDADGTVRVSVAAGRPLDEVVLRSWCIGAAHMGLSWVRSEGLTVGPDGTVGDLTIRSFGILTAAETPPVVVEIDRSDNRDPVRVSDAVMCAVAAAAWAAEGHPPAWPTRRG